MAKSNKSRVVTTVTAIVLLVIIAGAIGMAAWLTNGFEDEIKAFGVTINGKYYPNNAEGLVLDKHTTATVTTDDYEVTVSAKPVTEDFTFDVGAETYSWSSDAVLRDFTRGFDVTVKGDTFTMDYTDLAGVLAKTLQHDAEDIYVPDAPAGEDLFVVSVTKGSTELRIGFTLADLGGNANVESVSLDVTEIVF